MIYPNPTKGLINISSDSLISEIQIFDINGRILQNKIIENAKVETIDLSPFAAGVYLIEVQIDLGKTIK